MIVSIFIEHQHKAKLSGRQFTGLDVFHGSFTGNEILLQNANSYATLYIVDYLLETL